MQEAGAAEPVDPQTDAPAAPKVRRKRPKGPPKTRGQTRGQTRGRFSLTLLVVLVAMALVFAFLTMAYTGKTFRLPVWAVVEIETQLNASLARSRLSAGTALSISDVEVGVDRSFVPRFRLEDVRLLDVSGRSLLSLPEAELALDPEALLVGKIRPSALRLSGARLSVRRDEQGRIDLRFGASDSGPGPKSFGEVLDAVDAALSAPGLANLKTIEAEGLTLTFTDAQAGRSWQIGDGRLVIDNRPEGVAAELGLTLLEGPVPAQATLTVLTSKTSGSAMVTATVDKVAAADVAALSPPMAWLGFVQAPISGRFSVRLGENGSLATFSANLGLTAGTLDPGGAARPVPFDRADLSLTFDPATARIALSNLTVESRSLKLRASGVSDLLAADGSPSVAGALPEAFVGQLAFSEVMVDPEGLFQEPVRFSQGALDVRLRLDPFTLEIGQLALVGNDERLLLSGTLTAAPGGLVGALDVGLNRITTDRLLKLWPVSVVPKTRTRMAANVGQGTLFDVKAALRLAPGVPPRFTLGYEFADTAVRFVKTLPPVLDGAGHATLENNTYTVLLDRGHVLAPEGGRVEADGSVFQVLDITKLPATAKITLVTSSELTAALSLLDQEPFNFLSQAGQPVNLGAGQADLVAELTLPLKPKVTLPEVEYLVTGTIHDFSSAALVPGRVLKAPSVAVFVDTEGLQLSGKGTLGLLPIDVTYVQGFGAEQNGRARVNGTVLVSDAALRDLGVALPEGSVDGEATAAIDVALRKGEAPRLTLTSNLVGLTLRVPPLSWAKPAKTRGTLDLEATLSDRPEVETLTMKAPGLTLVGRVTTREGGGLDTASFSRVKAGDWLDAQMELTGSGSGNAVSIAITGGSLDIRNMPDTGGQNGEAGGSSPFSLALDRLVVSTGLSLTDFRGAFSPAGGLNGAFTATVNGKGEIAGALTPGKDGSAIRITSNDAGAVIAAAGMFDKARGGKLDLTLIPRGPSGIYDGKASFTRLRVQGAPALAELLSAISVVGLLEQMDGAGMAFNNGEMTFVLTPKAVEITQGSAIGASLGLSFAGLYDITSGQMNLQGVISPIYLLNGIGAILSRRGEGLFGFNYSLTGSADDPKVSVNPLSILTPGMFREIFRSAPPNLKEPGG